MLVVFEKIELRILRRRVRKGWRLKMWVERK